MFKFSFFQELLIFFFCFVFVVLMVLVLKIFVLVKIFSDKDYNSNSSIKTVYKSLNVIMYSFQQILLDYTFAN